MLFLSIGGTRVVLAMSALAAQRTIGSSIRRWLPAYLGTKCANQLPGMYDLALYISSALRNTHPLPRHPHLPARI